MACLLTQGFTVDCRDSVGGIETFYIGSLDEIASVTASAGVVTAIDTGSGAFYEYEVRKQTSNATETYTADDSNGTLFHEQEVTVQLSKMDATKRNEIFLLGKNRVMIIAKDRNGKYFLYGKKNGLTLGGSSQTGTAMGDLNGYTLTFTGAEEEPAFEVTGSIITDITA